MKNRRLNVLTLLFYWWRNLKLFFAFVVLLISLNRFIFLLIILFLLLFIDPIIRYLMFRYTLGKNELLVKSGLFFKKERHIPYERIQNIQRKQWFFLKPFHVEMVTIDTGAKTKKANKLELTAVNNRIIDEIEKRRNQSNIKAISNEEIHPQTTIRYRIKWPDLLIYAVTSANIFTEAFIVYSFWERYNVGKYFKGYSHQFESQIEHSGWLIISALIVTLIILLLIINVIRVIFKYYHFTLTRDDKNLTIQRGLLKTNTIHLATKKIQAVEIKQTVLRQLFGLVTVTIHLISDRNSSDDHHSFTLIPVVKKNIVTRVVHQFCNLVPEKYPQLVSGDGYMMWLFSRNSLIPVLILSAVIFYFYHGIFGAIGTGIIVLIVILNGLYKGYNTSVKQINDSELMLKTSRIFDNKTVFVGWHEIQSMKLRQSIWMKKRQRVHLEVAIRNGNDAKTFEYRYLPEAKVNSIFKWYRDFA